MENVATVQNSVDFRDAVMNLARGEGALRGVYAREHGTTGPTYRIIFDSGIRPITVNDLFRHHCAPVHMEDFATALVQAAKADGGVPKVDVFIL